MADVKDFKRVPKSHPKYNQRWYVNTKTGKEISRWEFQTLKAGHINPRERAKIRREVAPKSKAVRRQSNYNRLVQSFKTKTALKLGIRPRDVKVRGQSESAIEFRKLAKQLNNLSKRDQNDNSATGKKAQILVKLNLRKPEWDMPVGES